MKDYDHIYDSYIKAFMPYKDTVDGVSRASVEEANAIIRHLDYFQSLGCLLYHKLFLGKEEWLHYLRKCYGKYNWYDNIFKYTGKDRDEKYQQIRDAAYALMEIRPEMKPICMKLIHAIEKDIANELRKKYPELNVIFPTEKQLQEVKASSKDYAAGYRDGWNAMCQALVTAHTAETDVNHLIYSMHDIALDLDGAHFQICYDVLQREYKEYLTDVKLWNNNDPDMSCAPYPVNPPDPLPPARSYEEIFFDQLKEYNLHERFLGLVNAIELPTDEDVQKSYKNWEKAEKRLMGPQKE